MPYRINAITGELDLVDLDNVPPTVAITYNADAGSATPAAHIINFLGTAAQGISSSASGNTVTYTIANASAVQKGVASFNATNFTAAAGVITSNALTITAGTGLSTGGAVNLGGSVTLNLTVPVIAINGGTGHTTYAAGDILYASAINTLSKLPAAVDGQVLTLAAGLPSWVTPTGGTVTSVSGTAGRITSTGGATPVIDIDATYVGQASITTLGTVSIGVWNGTAVGPTFGGTGQTTYATGDMLYASAPNTLSKLAASTDGFTLVLAGGVPTWAATPSAGVDSVSGTLNRITISGTAADPVVDIAATYVGQTSITTLGTVTTGTWNGTVIGVVYGGTGLNNASQGDLLYGSAANTYSLLAKDTNATRYLSNTGTSNNPAWAQVNLTNGITGTLPIANGGTNGITAAEARNNLLLIGTGAPAQWFENLGISYNAGTGIFTVKGAQADLSATNYATIYLPSKATPGVFTRYTVTANQDFIDDNGASEIIGNLFGWTTGVAITVDVPFFIYAVSNDAENDIQFMLGRYPHQQLSSSTIGTPASASADAEGDMWAFDSITTSEYDQNPCVCIGSIRMRMSASDDWTVQTLSNTDGIGQYQNTISFTIPLGQLGANSGTVTVANGGTAPVFSTTTSSYYIYKDGSFDLRIFLSGDGGTDGSGAVNATVISPLEFSLNSTVATRGPAQSSFAGGNLEICQATSIGSNANYIQIYRHSTAALLQWAQFTNGNRSLILQIRGHLIGS